ncbi:MAG: hypothetical protein ACFFC7_19265 [Candidatus Hermodarchaeota archaeon]
MIIVSKEQIRWRINILEPIIPEYIRKQLLTSLLEVANLYQEQLDSILEKVVTSYREGEVESAVLDVIRSVSTIEAPIMTLKTFIYGGIQGLQDEFQINGYCALCGGLEVLFLQIYNEKRLFCTTCLKDI